MTVTGKGFKASSERIHLLINAVTKAKELGDAILLAEEAGLLLDLTIETSETGGRLLRHIVVAPVPQRVVVH